MAQDKAGELVGGTFDPKALPGLGAERTTEEVLADIVAKDPAAHGVTIEERKRRAEAEARRIAAENRAFFENDNQGGANPDVSTARVPEARQTVEPDAPPAVVYDDEQP